MVPENDYVLPGINMTHFENARGGFCWVLKQIGIVDFRFHDFRYTFGSQMVLQGVDIWTVQQVMGFKTIKMPMRYSHLSSEYVEESKMRLDCAWTLFGHQAGSGKMSSSVSTCHN